MDHYLKNRQPTTFCAELRNRLLLSPQEAMSCGTRYNVPLLNALVLYMGIQAIAQLQSKAVSPTIVYSHIPSLASRESKP